eukprot:XP_008657749.1 uncharacterized protein LOC103637306 [Zea mays]
MARLDGYRPRPAARLELGRLANGDLAKATADERVRAMRGVAGGVLCAGRVRACGSAAHPAPLSAPAASPVAPAPLPAPAASPATLAPRWPGVPAPVPLRVHALWRLVPTPRAPRPGGPRTLRACAPRDPALACPRHAQRVRARVTVLRGV